MSLVYGAVLAVSRGDVAESLAYSAIGQVGYVLVALGVGGPVGLSAAVLYSAVNALNKTLLFLSAELRGALVAAAFAGRGAQRRGCAACGRVRREAGDVPRRDRCGKRARPVVLLVVGSAFSLVYMFQIYQRRFWRDRSVFSPDRRPRSRCAC